VALLPGNLQRRLVVARRAQRHVRTRSQQAEHHGTVGLGGEHQSGDAFAVLQVDLCAVSNQRVDNPLLAAAGSTHQRSAAVAV